MDELSLVKYTFKGVEVRTQRDASGEPLFCLSDVCKVLGLSNPSKVASQVCEEFELPNLKLGSFDTGFGVKEFHMVSEPQL